MKLCISSEGTTLDSKVTPRLGRCRMFIIVDTESMAFEVVDNAETGASCGAGIQVGQFVAFRGVEAVMTGNVGPNAIQTLQEGGIAIYTGVSGTVREAVDGFRRGLYQATGRPIAASKAGVK